MLPNIIVVTVVIIISLLIFSWIFKVFKTTLSTVLTIAIILFFVQLTLGISYQDIWQEMQQFIIDNK